MHKLQKLPKQTQKKGGGEGGGLQSTINKTREIALQTRRKTTSPKIQKFKKKLKI